MREVWASVEHRVFARLGLTDRASDALTFPQNRQRRSAGTGVHRDIIDSIGNG